MGQSVVHGHPYFKVPLAGFGLGHFAGSAWAQLREWCGLGTTLRTVLKAGGVPACAEVSHTTSTNVPHIQIIDQHRRVHIRKINLLI